jgi:ribonuclease BN (tRNA processing enzyme)
VRYYGLARAHELLVKLRCIWITHKHADHCAGVVNLIRIVNQLKRQQQPQQRSADSSSSSSSKESRQRWECSVCGFEFRYRKSREMHLPIHHIACVVGSEVEDDLYTSAASRTEEESNDPVDFLPSSSSPSVLVVGPFWVEPWYSHACAHTARTACPLIALTYVRC